MKIGTIVGFLVSALGFLCLVVMWHDIRAHNYSDALFGGYVGTFLVLLGAGIRKGVFAAHRERWQLWCSVLFAFLGLAGVVDAFGGAVWGPDKPELIDWAVAILLLSLALLFFAFWLRRGVGSSVLVGHGT